MKVLVAGGTGFIGSHTSVELLESGCEVVCIDNLSNSKLEVVDKIKKITSKEMTFYNINLCDKKDVFDVFEKESKIKKFDCVIMFAGYKAVGESVEKPLEYYENNLISLINICFAMKKFECNSIIFSSSATVYGDPKVIPVTEGCEKGKISSPYGQTKSMIEQILEDYASSDKNISVTLLRYFNPIGAHESGLIGEDPNGIPNNLVPYIADVAMGKREYLRVFGNDYDTKDGTGIRDYIHVVDLAKGHVAALKNVNKPGVFIYNLGTGTGYSVLDVVNMYEKASGKKIPYKILERRKGDVARLYCDPSKAKKELGWSAKLTLYDMCKDSYNYQIKGRNNV